VDHSREMLAECCSWKSGKIQKAREPNERLCHGTESRPKCRAGKCLRKT